MKKWRTIWEVAEIMKNDSNCKHCLYATIRDESIECGLDWLDKKQGEDCQDYVQTDTPMDLRELEIERKAEENLRKWNKYIETVKKASDEAGITLEQGLKFIDAHIKLLD